MQAYDDDFWTSAYDLDHPTAIGDGYAPIPPLRDDHTRLFALNRAWNNADQAWYERLRLGGEVDFNFKSGMGGSAKYEHLRQIAGDNEDLIAMLDACKSMHAARINYSLMQSVGSLQNYKGGLPESDLIGGKSGFALDRLDSFVSSLARFYRAENRLETSIIRNYRDTYPNGRRALAHYLSQFEDVYDYCSKVYLLRGRSGRDLIDQLIESGAYAIAEPDDVTRYLNLALAFWAEKAHTIEGERKE